MTHTLLPLAYAGPIAHWIPICKQQPILWEVEDFYQKQTYRNRMEIHAANGKLMLVFRFNILVTMVVRTIKMYRSLTNFLGKETIGCHLKPHISPPLFLNTMKMILRPFTKHHTNL